MKPRANALMKPDWTKEIWNGVGLAQAFKLKIDLNMKERLLREFESARISKQSKLVTSSAKALFKSLERRGVVVKYLLPKYDRDDVVGLVGEILTKEASVQKGFEQMFAKFEATGTSKSRGIDLVLLGSCELTELRLVEVKHLHRAVMGKSPVECPIELRARLKAGLDEFESERTIVNLAYIIMSLTTAALDAKGADVGMSDLDEKIRFLILKLEGEDYDLEVSACMDSRYCDANTLDTATRGMALSDEIGRHEVCLSLLNTDGLEAFTMEACKKYA